MNVHKEKFMKCPSCPDAVLTMADRQGVGIDYCPQCRGVWLDRGELDKLIERAAAPQVLDERDIRLMVPTPKQGATLLRTYPNNSPQAAARIVALAMLADGHLCKSELDALDDVDAHTQLGLRTPELHAIVRSLCEDLLTCSHRNWEAACRVDPGTLTALMAEIDDPHLRAKVLRLCATVIAADEHVTEGEADFLAAAVDRWRLPRDKSGMRISQPEVHHV